MKSSVNHTQITAHRLWVWTITAILIVSCVAVAGHAAEPLLTPAPRELTWTKDRLDLGTQCTIVAGREEQPTARILAAEM